MTQDPPSPVPPGPVAPSPDLASLDRLHDVVTPPSVPFWPPAPGWLWLLGLVSLLGLVAFLRWLAGWQQNRYRREALTELQRLEAAASTEPSRGEALVGMAELLKRVAMTAYSRERVATLTGVSWFDFLDRTGGTRFGQGLGAALEGANYRPGSADWDGARLAELVSQIRHWIRRHGPLAAVDSRANESLEAPSVPRPAA